MSSAPATDRRRRVLLAAATAAVTAVSALTVSLAHAGVTDANSPAAGLYVVQFDAPPAAGYTGGIAGIPATKPVPGDRLDTRTRQYEEYRKHLRAQRSQALRAVKVDGRKVVTEYNTAFNGVAANLTTAEVGKLSGPRSAEGHEATLHAASNRQHPDVPGAGRPGGAWRQAVRRSRRAPAKASSSVSSTPAIWPENPSFGALPEPRPDQDVIDAQVARQPASPATRRPVTCNNKVIGARWYNVGGADDRPCQRSSTRRATTTATARTPPAPRPATTA